MKGNCTECGEESDQLKHAIGLDDPDMEADLCPNCWEDMVDE